MNKKLKEFIAFVLVIGLLVSTPGVFAAAASPRLNKKAVTITIGNTVELTVKNTTKKVKWSSSNKAVAKVDSDGDVTAKKAGKAKITAKVGKKKYTCNVTVPKQYISAKSAFIQKGSKQKLNIYGVSKSDSLFWGSDYERIATVSQSGEITANSIGETTVYVVINNGYGEMYECDVVVYEKTASGDIVTSTPKPTMTPEPTKTPENTNSSRVAVTNVTLSDSSIRLATAEQKVLKASVVPSNATNQKVTWSSGNTNVARVGSDGTVTGVSAGTTMITVKTEDGSFMAACTVTVSGVVMTPKPTATPTAAATATPSATPKPSIVPVNKVTLSSKSLQMKAGEIRTLTATISPTDASNKEVTWRSGNESVVKVDNKGKVTAVAAGTTMVIVTTTDGEYSAFCTITVTGNNATPTPTVPSSATPTTKPTASPTTSPTPTASPTPVPPASATPSPSVSPSPSISPAPDAFALNRISLEIPEGQEYEFAVTGVSETVAWVSSNTNIAEVSQDGKLTAKGVGSATITASADGETASCVVTVIENVEAVLEYNDNNTVVTGCTNASDATYIEIPEEVTKIEREAFKELSKLWGISIPDSVTEIGDSAFMNCTNLCTIRIPNGVTVIAASTFHGCSNLESVTMPDGVTGIGSQAFYGCSSLKDIRIPDSVTEIAADAFEECGDVKICGVIGSYAERWANENGYEFEEENDEKIMN